MSFPLFYLFFSSGGGIDDEPKKKMEGGFFLIFSCVREKKSEEVHKLGRAVGEERSNEHICWKCVLVAALFFFWS